MRISKQKADENHSRLEERNDIFRRHGMDVEKNMGFVLAQALPLPGRILENGGSSPALPIPPFGSQTACNSDEQVYSFPTNDPKKVDILMKAIRTTEAPAAIGPYSQAIAEGSLLFTSGQLPIDPATGELRNGDIVTAARQALMNLRAVLVAGGANTNTVIKTTVFLKDMRDFQAFNGVYAEFFSEPFPARSCVQVAALPKDALVEIEAVAARE